MLDINGRAGCPHPAGFISQTNDCGVSARVFAYLFPVPYADSMPATPAGWFVRNRGGMRASRPTDYHRRTAKNEGHPDHHILHRRQQNNSRAGCPHPAGFVSRTNGYGVSARVFAYFFPVPYADSIFRDNQKPPAQKQTVFLLSVRYASAVKAQPERSFL